MAGKAALVLSGKIAQRAVTLACIPKKPKEARQRWLQAISNAIQIGRQGFAVAQTTTPSNSKRPRKHIVRGDAIEPLVGIRARLFELDQERLGKHSVAGQMLEPFLSVSLIISAFDAAIKFSMNLPKKKPKGTHGRPYFDQLVQSIVFQTYFHGGELGCYEKPSTHEKAGTLVKLLRLLDLPEGFIPERGGQMKKVYEAAKKAGLSARNEYSGTHFKRTFLRFKEAS